MTGRDLLSPRDLTPIRMNSASTFEEPRSAATYDC